MESNQIKLLLDLAKKVSNEEKDRTMVVASLQSARILTKHENFSTHLKNLDKVFSLEGWFISEDQI